MVVRPQQTVAWRGVAGGSLDIIYCRSLRRDPAASCSKQMMVLPGNVVPRVAVPAATVQRRPLRLVNGLYSVVGGRTVHGRVWGRPQGGYAV